MRYFDGSSWPTNAEAVRDASISRHATEQPPMSLEDAAVIQAGARAFDQRGCTQCHGAPGVKWAKFSEGLRPDPPDLGDVAKELSAQQIFWVVKNGINMTGMPSFAHASPIASPPPTPCCSRRTHVRSISLTSLPRTAFRWAAGFS